MRSCWSSAARIRETAVSICGSKNGSLSELRRGRRKFSTSSAQRNPFRESNRAMHSDPQILLHAIAPPFSSSRDAKIQRLCRVKVPERFPSCNAVALGTGASIALTSTRLCTDQFIRRELPAPATFDLSLTSVTPLTAPLWMPIRSSNVGLFFKALVISVAH